MADIGCGPGELTADLCRALAGADVLGVDNSAEMIAEASRLAAASHRQAAVRAAGRAGLEAERPVDVIVSNALLQWIPDHEVLLTRWAGWLADGGWLAAQIPANYDEPTHRLLRELAASARWQRLLG